MSKLRIRDLAAGLGIGLAAFVLVWLEVPVLSTVALPALFAAAGALGGWTAVACSAVLFSAAGVAVFSGAFLPLAALAAVAGIGGYLALSRTKRAFDSLVGCCAAALLSIWANILCGAAIAGKAVIDQVFTVDPLLLDAMEQSYLMIGYDAATVGALRAEMAASYGEMVPGVLLMTAMAVGLLTFAAGSWLMKGRKHYTVPPFGTWRMPKGYLLGGVVLLLAAMGGRALGWNGFESVTLAVEFFVLTMYAIQGISVIWFFLSRTRMGAFFKAVIVVILVPLAGTGLVFVAMIEDILQLRRRMPPPGWKPRGPQGPSSL